jgi:hypothetical protein
MLLVVVLALLSISSYIVAINSVLYINVQDGFALKIGPQLLVVLLVFNLKNKHSENAFFTSWIELVHCNPFL